MVVKQFWKLSSWIALTLMILFLVGHLVESLNVFLCLSVHFIQLFVSCYGLTSTDLKNDSHLCIRQDMNVVELRPEPAFSGIFFGAGF